MTILASDIQLMESERMRDTSDGGGRQTGEAIVSGEVGNIFPKISRTDSVYGRVNLRKIYLAVRTANNDVYGGAHAIISAPPANERISCLLFSTESAFDTRDAARDRIESYVVAGPLSRMRLYGNQLIGQQAILTYQPESEPLPDVGQVYVLSTENSGGVVSASQYVRITDVTHEVRTFTDDQGDFLRRVITLKLGSRLDQTFSGGEVVRFSTDTSATKLRQTQVADASQYYGLVQTTETADIGDLSLNLDSVYAALVPSTQRETGLSLASAPSAQTLIAAASENYTGAITGYNDTNFAVGTSTTGGLTLTLQKPPFPGSYWIRQTAPNGINLLWSDQGDGTLLFTGTGSGSTAGGGTIDYENARVSLWHSAGGFGNVAVVNYSYLPASSIAQSAHTRSIAITLSTRGSVYAETMNPLPAPGTLIVDFRALGKWYRMRDNGLGVLEANDPSEGTGSVDYVTGATIVTLGALPDVDSAVIFSWGSPVHTTIRAGATTDATSVFQMDYTLEHEPIVPGTFIATYTVNSASRSTTADSNGAISGSGVTGTINYATGAIKLLFSTPPDTQTNISNAYTWRDGADLIVPGTSAVISGGAFTVPGTAPFRNAGVMTFTIQPPGKVAIPIAASITSAGVVNIAAGEDQMVKWAAQTVGTFNATTGVVTITASVAAQTAVWDPPHPSGGGTWNYESSTHSIASVSSIAVERDTVTFDPQAVTAEVLTAPGVTLDLTATVADTIVPGSVMFTATGKTYIDRGTGTLYADVNATTGVGTNAGTINYETGVCSLTYWANNAAVSRSVLSCLTQYGDWTAESAYFRTAGSPIRPASLYIQVTGADGTLITGTADTNGVITGTYMRGNVQQDMGVVEVEFGEEIASVWTPIEVMPETLRYNCVVISNLPLDPDILGLDPVRLPSDGRVPIFRPGDIAVIHNTDTTALTNPVVADTTYSVGRTDLYSCTLADATGTAISDALYSVDLDAGTVTIDAAWTGSGITQPLTATHRVEDMVLLSDVQINGQIEFASPLAHEYPVGSYASSALLFGDLQAIVTNVFDQQTWGGEWSDAPIGSQATAQFDDINYPISCLNESAVTERWRINFTSTTAFQIIGENLGVIATGNTSTLAEPVNPVTGDAYFSIPVGGWGSGWATGNQLRFNTLGASGPTWIARTILAGASLEGDQFGFEGRGDVD